MNGSFSTIDELVSLLNNSSGNASVDIVVAPPAPYLHYVVQNLKHGMQVAAQNCYKVPSGAFTGEISPAMIKDLGANFVILGHSERRHVFGENDHLISEKAAHAFDSGINVIYCIGEKLEEREGNKTKEVNFRQLDALLKLPNIDWKKVVIAYEPVWAIGTGKTASPEQAEEVHKWIRDYLEEKVSKEIGQSTRIIYGGSVTAGNCEELAKQPDVDGFLICLETTLGEIDIELWSRECPLACRNFVQLCMENYYVGCTFHRLIRDFIVQTGDPTGTGHGGTSIYGDSEFHQRLKFNRRGLVGMASDKKDQNASQFFFTLGPAPDLNGKHTLFGKVVGATVFNLMKMNEYEVDANERPSRLHKITGIKILENPFRDIRIRSKSGKEERLKEKKSRDAEKIQPKRNTALLSFGDEIDEDEEQASKFQLKGKSAHDVLVDDISLSKEEAVGSEEISHKRRKMDIHIEEDLIEIQEREERMDRIKNKFKSSKKVVQFNESSKVEEDDDIEKIVEDYREAEKKNEMERISSELRQLQKEYKKSMRESKGEKPTDDEASTSTGMKMYNKLKLNFKSGTKGVVKTVDPRREEQTIALLGRFQTRLQRASVQGVLVDKKVDMSDQKSREDIILATSEDQGKIDFDAEDIQGEDWMNHELIAPEDTSGVTKAKGCKYEGGK
ncbi:PPIase cyclophilin-type domain-containing protein [Meloidogyne graminicola]|uniref:Triosephosphate isomerase n=1 Tax=Meloidogyne graminicola TaxID=189291 RepID=A0A8T0A492_9BILA|nr:PPIase cyclophilin-type domain-containing protein [Meloidogyne graminicola]